MQQCCETSLSARCPAQSNHNVMEASNQHFQITPPNSRILQAYRIFSFCVCHKNCGFYKLTGVVLLVFFFCNRPALSSDKALGFTPGLCISAAGRSTVTRCNVWPEGKPESVPAESTNAW